MSVAESTTIEPIVPLSELFGLLAEFDRPSDLMAAANNAYTTGYRRMEAYTPFPIHGLAKALGKASSWLLLITLLGGALGAASGYGMQYWMAVISYPVNIGDRPYHSWPAFFPVTFELAVLGAATFAVLGMLALNGLPMPYHPVFNVPEFKLASRNRFFLIVLATDPRFERSATREFLTSLHPHAVYDVPR